MALVGEHNQQRGSAIRTADLVALQEDSRRGKIIESPDIVPEETGRGVALLLTAKARRSGSAGFLAAVQTDFQTGTQIPVKVCDANGNTTGSAFNVYVYAGGGSADLTAVTVANASATATCKLAAGKIIACAYSGADAYLLGDVAQIVYDVRYDTSSHKFQAQVYWRVGIAVSTVSGWLDVRACTQVTAITAWQVDGTSGEIQKKTQAFYAPEVGSESAWTKIDDTTESKPSSCTAQAS
jgi:hypothetical protein